VKKRRKATVSGLTQLFGNNVRFYRTMMGWSQEGLAERMNVSKNTIHDIETGRKFVRAQSLTELSDVFNIEVYKLFLPKNTQNVDSARIVAQFASHVKESVENIRDQFIKKGS
jgi:transcriptional regulator with XRE-family HTH domain